MAGFGSIKEPGRKDWAYVRGDSFMRTFVIKQGGAACDLTGYEVKAQIRERPDTDVLADFTAVVVAPATDGRVRISLTTTQTAVLPPESKWDLQIVLTAAPTTNTHTMLAGKVTVCPDITE